MEQKRCFRGIVFLLVFFSMNSNAASFKADLAQSKLGFVSQMSKLFVTLDVEGHFSDYKVDVVVPMGGISRTMVSVKIPVATVDTGIKKRDNHLRTDDFFDVKKHPTASFKSKKIEIINDTHIKITGILQIRGKEKEVQFDAELTKTKNGYKTKGELTVNRKDFDINYKGGVFLPNVKDPVRIVFDVTLVPT